MAIFGNDRMRGGEGRFVLLWVLGLISLLWTFTIDALGAWAQDVPLSLELVEVVPDTPNGQFPTITSGQVSQVDPEYGNYSSEHVWTPPPDVIGADGFTLNLQTQASQKTGGGITAGTGVGGTGFSFDQSEAVAWAVVPNGAPGSNSGSLAVRVTPTGLTWGGTAELRIGASWGAGVTYRYRVSGEPPGNDGTTGDGTVDNEPTRMLAATAECDSAEIVISALPSLSCRLLISGWQRNTANPVFVELPAAIDGFGNHANGLQLVLASGQEDVFNWDEPVRSWGFFAFACPGQQGAGVNCYGSVTTPGAPVTVPISVRQGDQQVTVNLTLNPVARGATSDSGTVGAPFRIGNRWFAGAFLNIESGSLAASTIRSDWLSAQWTAETVDGGFVRLRSVWNTEVFLNAENQVLQAGAVPSGSWSALWVVEPVDNTGYFRLRNGQVEGQYLHMQNGVIELGPIAPDWLGAQWWALP